MPLPSKGDQPKRSGRTLSTRARLERVKTRFLEELELCASVKRACQRAKLARRTYYDMREQDPEFAAQADAARDRGIDALEDDCLADAQHGLKRPIYQGGKLVGHEIVKDTKLRELMLKSHRPERYREGNALAAAAGDLLALLVNMSRPSEISAPRGQLIDQKPQEPE